jgi:hypothetical protein
VTRLRTSHALSVGALAMVVTVVLGLAPGQASATLAVWASAGSGTAAGAAAVMPTGSAPSGSAVGSAVTISWSTATFANGAPVAGYVINRYNAATGAQATVGPGCNGVVTATSCTESPVPGGQWQYTETPVQLGWTGRESPASAVIVVIG